MSESTVMPPDAEQAIERLLELPPMLRLEASERLAESVEENEIRAAWMRVAERRAMELRSGAVKAVNMHEMFAEAKRMINESRSHSS
jgi:hypothetical protein